MAKLIHSLLPHTHESFEGTAVQALGAVLAKWVADNRAHHQAVIQRIANNEYGDQYTAEFLAARRAESVRSVESPNQQWTVTPTAEGFMLHPLDLPFPQETFYLVD